MNHDLRYDGPDLESETGGRLQGVLMSAVMVAEAVQQGRQARAQRPAPGPSQDPTQLRQGTGSEDLGEASDGALAQRWQASADRHGDAAADRARAGVEAELAARDPETMRDYRSWRNAAGALPVQAMQRALQERDARLAALYGPLAGPGAAALGRDELLQGWAAAHAAHDPQDPQDAHGDGAAAAARGSGERLLRQREPELMAAFDALRAAGAAEPDAAARLTGGRAAFTPQAWAAVRAGSAKGASATVRTAAPAAGPAGAAAAVAVGLLQRLARRDRQR
jgi:hypothetical protein